MHIKRSMISCALVSGILALSACSPIYTNHGYIPPEENLTEIVVGVDDRSTVDDIVGPPSSTGVLGESGYFYVRSKFKAVGPRRPKEVERQVLAISFDEGGTVQNIERFGLEDGRVVALSRRVTKGGVEDKTFLRQLLGNIGNFNPGDFLGDG
ncbi:MAG: outer membrane protein assembly factor BamE [Paracoccaceae bacterium]